MMEWGEGERLRTLLAVAGNTVEALAPPAHGDIPTISHHMSLLAAAGDIVEVLPSGALKIIDRKKNMVKLAQGAW